MKQADKNISVVLTGGHLSPALAVLEEAKRLKWQIYWIGEKRKVEERVVRRFGVPFYSIYSAKFQRFSPLLSLLSFWKLFVGFWQSLNILSRIRPAVVIGFGSYVSVPPALAAWFLRIPILIHEQTASSGLANRFLSHLAVRVAISFQESARFFPKEKTIIVGSLIRRGLISAASQPRRRGGSVLYITGGSRGAVAINDVVFAILPALLEKFEKIYHQTGEIDYGRFKRFLENLPADLKSKYVPASFFPPGKVEKILLEADMAVSRSGANTVAEFALFGIPAILIPLPFAEASEQKKNALLLKKTGLAEILEQERLTASSLLEMITNMQESLQKYRKAKTKALKLAQKDALPKFIHLIRTVTSQ